MELLVKQADREDIFGDLARLHTSHRPGILAGSICRISVGSASVLAVARNSKSNETGTISLDDALRTRLKIKDGESYEFKIVPAGLWDQFNWAWSASNPVNRIASRLGVLSVALGLLGLLLGILSVWLSVK